MTRQVLRSPLLGNWDLRWARFREARVSGTGKSTANRPPALRITGYELGQSSGEPFG